MQIKSIGIDLGKTTFHLVVLGTRSQLVVPDCLYFNRLPEGGKSHFAPATLMNLAHPVRSNICPVDDALGTHVDCARKYVGSCRRKAVAVVTGVTRPRNRVDCACAIDNPNPTVSRIGHVEVAFGIDPNICRKREHGRRCCAAITAISKESIAS